MSQASHQQNSLFLLGPTNIIRYLKESGQRQHDEGPTSQEFHQQKFVPQQYTGTSQRASSITAEEDMNKTEALRCVGVQPDGESYIVSDTLTVSVNSKSEKSAQPNS